MATEEKKQYWATAEGFINGMHYRKNALVGEMTAAEAKYLVMAGQVTDTNPRGSGKEAEADEDQDKPARARRGGRKTETQGAMSESDPPQTVEGTVEEERPQPEIG